MHQQGFSGKRFALPCRSGKFPSFDRGCLPADFIFTPPRRVVAQEKLCEAAIPARAEVIRIKINLPVVCSERFLRSRRIGKGLPEIIPRPGMHWIETQALLITDYGFIKTT